MGLELRRREAAPFNGEFVPLRVMMNQLFENAFTPPDLAISNASPTVAWEIYDDADAYHIRAYLSGVDPDTVDVTVQDGVLTLSGETTPTTPEGWRPLVREIGHGPFRRQVTLGVPVETGTAAATYRDGILAITLPKADIAKPHRIKIGAVANGK
jgi:HSP20 family protein